MKFLIGKKQDMSQRFLADGTVVPVTRIIAGPCFVTRKIDFSENKIKSVQLAWREISNQKLNKPLRGFFAKSLGIGHAHKYLKEFRLTEDDKVYDKLNVGQKLDASIFVVGDKVDVSGVSKGKGFQGVVKRHGFSGGKKSHGHKDQLRMPGSIGAKGPARVFKGTRMAGQMGNKKATSKNLEVVEVIPEKNEIFVKGAVPGARNGLIFIFGAGDFEPSGETKAKETKISRASNTKETMEKSKDKAIAKDKALTADKKIGLVAAEKSAPAATEDAKQE